MFFSAKSSESPPVMLADPSNGLLFNIHEMQTFSLCFLACIYEGEQSYVKVADFFSALLEIVVETVP